MTILLRVDAHEHSFTDDERKAFIAWLDRLGVDGAKVRACAVEAPAVETLDDHYLLHVTEYERNDRGGIVLDYATNKPKLKYRTVRLEDRDWPDIRAVEALRRGSRG